MSTVWERMANRRQERRFDRRNPLQGDSPLQGAQTANRGALDARAGMESQRYAQDRRGLSGVLAGYQGLAAGTGPNPAQVMLQQAQQRNIASTIAAMGSARGGNLGANSMAAATAGAAMGQQGAMDASLMQAQQQLQGLEGQAGIAGQLAGLSSGREMGLLGMGQNALMGQAGMMQEWELERARLAQQAQAQRSQAILGGLQLGAQVGGDVLGGVLSDEREKTNVEPVKRGGLAALLAKHDDRGQAAAELGDVEPYEFEYTPRGRKKGGIAGRLAGVMAQQLELGPKGREAVREDEDGTKRLDVARSLSLALAAGADHERRMRALEGKAA
jgi:hypothetical protein